MDDRRIAQRMKDVNEITITVMSGEKSLPREKIFYNYSEDISVSGAKIQANILLPIDTIIKIDFALKTLKKQITAIGKVKWIKVVIDDEYYEAGVEFIDTPIEAIKKIRNYISRSTSLKPEIKPFWIYAKFNEPKSK